MDYVTIENDLLGVTVDLNGGALHSITDRRDGTELMWDGSCGWKSATSYFSVLLQES